MIRMGTSRKPVLVATDVCLDLALGRTEAVEFFASAPVEIRLSTATYLELLSQARSPDEVSRLRQFVQEYPVLSLGPMASSRAVEMLINGAVGRLSPLQALVAATAIAHEIPLVTGNPDPYQGIPELDAVSPY